MSELHKQELTYALHLNRSNAIQNNMTGDKEFDQSMESSVGSDVLFWNKNTHGECLFH